jgi:hypothetical protein
MTTNYDKEGDVIMYDVASVFSYRCTDFITLVNMMYNFAPIIVKEWTPIESTTLYYVAKAKLTKDGQKALFRFIKKYHEISNRSFDIYTQIIENSLQYQVLQIVFSIHK